MSIVKEVVYNSKNIILEISKDMMSHLNTIILDNQMLVENDSYQVLDVLYNCPGLMYYDLRETSLYCEISSQYPWEETVKDIKHELLDLLERKDKHNLEDLNNFSVTHYSSKFDITFKNEDLFNDFKNTYEENYIDNGVFININNVEDIAVLDNKISLIVKENNFPRIEITKKVINKIDEIYQKRTPQIKL